LYLKNGKIIFDGVIEEAAKKYEQTIKGK